MPEIQLSRPRNTRGTPSPCFGLKPPTEQEMSTRDKILTRDKLTEPPTISAEFQLTSLFGLVWLYWS